MVDRSIAMLVHQRVIKHQFSKSKSYPHTIPACHLVWCIPAIPAIFDLETSNLPLAPKAVRSTCRLNHVRISPSENEVLRQDVQNRKKNLKNWQLICVNHSDNDPIDQLFVLNTRKYDTTSKYHMIINETHGFPAKMPHRFAKKK